MIAPKIGGAKAKDGTVIAADFQLAGGPSVLFDCLFLALSNEGAAALVTEAAAVGFVHDGFAHLKVIGATPEAQPLLDKAGVVADDGILIVNRVLVCRVLLLSAPRWEEFGNESRSCVQSTKWATTTHLATRRTSAGENQQRGPLRLEKVCYITTRLLAAVMGCKRPTPLDPRLPTQLTGTSDARTRSTTSELLADIGRQDFRGSFS